MFTTCSLCVLFSLYYVTPSNYKLCKISESDKLLFKKEYIIEPNKKKKIKTLKYSDKYIRIFSENIDFLKVLVENKFKSENLYISKDDLIKLVKSDMIIKNDISDKIKVTVEFYDKE
jgi:hypothetical protein